MARVRQAQLSDRNELAKLRVLLWPEGSIEEHLRELAEVLATGMNGTLPMAILVAEDANGLLLGFLEVGMRSHADGCDSARPVGYVEGWFVHESHRNLGVGRELMLAAEEWARARGCSEMASDALIDNDQSHRAHQAMGFQIVDRCVLFRKALKR